jgi:hypothetical protein
MKFQVWFLHFTYCSFGCLVKYPYEILMVLVTVLSGYIHCLDVMHVGRSHFTLLTAQSHLVIHVTWLEWCVSRVSSECLLLVPSLNLTCCTYWAPHTHIHIHTHFCHISDTTDTMVMKSQPAQFYICISMILIQWSLT